MSTSPSSITLHMVSSLDGFIAKEDGDVSWMRSTDTYEQGIELTEEIFNDFITSIDCYVMGSKTYEHALKLGWPYGDKPVIVCSSRPLNTDRETVSFYSGDLSRLASELKAKYKNIWMVGGARLTKAFIRQRLADKIIVTIMPVILGEGLLFFDHVGTEQKLHLEDITAYKDGMVEMTYELLR